jgi:asparagine synthase (glutamine-hydrolysing)
VTVALSADGADEFFGGYARYAVCGSFVRRRSLPFRALYGLSAEMIERFPPGLLAAAYTWTRGRRGGYAGINDKLRKFARMVRAEGRFEMYEAAVSEWPRTDVSRLLKSAAPSSVDARSTYESVRDATPEEEFMHFDAARYLPGDLLTKLDRASMSVSLEAREPFLDQDLAKLGIALPMHWKIRNGQNKYALRRILGRYHPTEIFDRPKKGFSVPLGEWLRGPLKELLLDELSAKRVKDIGLLDANAVQASLEDFFDAGRRTSPAGLWFLLQLQQWAGRWTRSTQPSLGLAAAG